MRLCFGICSLPIFLESDGSSTDCVDTWPGLSSLELLELEGKISEQL